MRNRIGRLAAVLLPIVTIAIAAPARAQVYFSPDPGVASASVSASACTLSNAALRVTWKIAGDRLEGGDFADLLTRRTMPAQPLLFVIVLGDGTILRSSDMRAVSPPKSSDLGANASASRMSDRVRGKAIVADFEAADPSVRDRAPRATWQAILRDGSNYVRQEITLTAGTGDVPIREVRLIDWTLRDVRVIGTVKGSPVVSDTLFAGFEDPQSSCAVAGGRARCWIERELPLKAGQSVGYSSVAGVTAAGQLRRGFLNYVERERAHPYRTFLHYNSWYDLGYFSKYDEAGALAVVNAFGTELTRKRGVALDSFLFDDGWDDPATLWHFNAGFPDGFATVREAASAYKAAPGVWLSPWGGYGKPKQERVAAGRAAGYEVVDNGFALSGPKYYAAFRDACARFIKDFGVNQFKIDGTGNANRVFLGSEFDSDFSAAIHLIGELRAMKPDVYINLTTGTYPSPFWLRYADSIWRGGEDHDFLGAGSKREQWITYRDADVYEHVVLRGPLFPLNSLMLHGLIYAKHAKNLDTDPQHDFANEVHDYFGTGTQLQEMYVTPSLLSQADWDVLAEAAAWSRANADVLVDTHWIGGDPAQLEPYGWASWSPTKAILVLRNPSGSAQTIDIDVERAFELPAGAARAYSLRSPWKSDRGSAPIRIEAARPHTFELKPFEVLVLEKTP